MKNSKISFLIALFLTFSTLLSAQPTLLPEFLNEGVTIDDTEELSVKYQQKIKPLLTKDDVDAIKLWHKMKDKIEALKEKLKPVLDGSDILPRMQAQVEELNSLDLELEEYQQRALELQEEFKPQIMELYQMADINVEEVRQEFREILPSTCMVDDILSVSCEFLPREIDPKYQTNDDQEFNPQYPPEHHFSFDQIAYTNTDKNWVGAAIPTKEARAEQSGFSFTKFGLKGVAGTVYGYAQVGNYINVPPGTKSVVVTAEYDHWDDTNAWGFAAVAWAKTQRKLIINGPQVNKVAAQSTAFCLVPLFGTRSDGNRGFKNSKLATVFTPDPSGGKYQVILSNHGDAQTAGVGSAKATGTTRNVRFRVSFYR